MCSLSHSIEDIDQHLPDPWTVLQRLPQGSAPTGVLGRFTRELSFLHTPHPFGGGVEGGWEHPCPTLPLALPSPPRRPASGPTCLAGQSLGFGAETLQVVVAPLFVLLQGTLLFVAPATVVALVGLAHRGRGDCGADRKDTALVTPPCALALQSHGGGERDVAQVNSACLSFPTFSCKHGRVTTPRRRGPVHGHGRREGTRGL